MDVQECYQLVRTEQDPRSRSPLELSMALQEVLRALRGGRGDLELVHFPDALTKSVRFNVEAMHVELAELLDLFPWKEWRDYPTDFWTDERLEEIKFEIIDLLHFVNNLFIAMGMDDEAIKRYYWAKHKENVQRQYGKYGKPDLQLPEEYR